VRGHLAEGVTLLRRQIKFGAVNLICLPVSSVVSGTEQLADPQLQPPLRCFDGGETILVGQRQVKA
jgi:hypothetical protein